MKQNEDKKKARGPLLPPEEQFGAEGPPRPRLGRQMLIWAIALGAILVAFFVWKRMDRALETEVTVGQFTALMDAGQIQELHIEGIKGRGVFRTAGGMPSQFWVTLTQGFIDRSIGEWAAKLPQNALTVKEPPGMLPVLLLQMVPVLLIILLVVYFLNRQMRAVTSRDGWAPFVSNAAMYTRKEKSAVTFDDVAGVDEAKEEVQEIVEFLKNPEKFQRLGGRIPRGVLLVGAPGTGKTLLAKAIAGEADVPFFSLCGSDFVELFVGVGAARVRDLFRKARQNQPAIIFLDEIDAVGRKRGTGLGGGHDEREQTLNAILSEMDGFTRDEGVIVIAATNRPDVLDPALQRPGRFDRQIVVDLPDLKGRDEVLKVHTRNVRLGDDVALDRIARGTPGFTGADLEALVNEGAIRAAVRGCDRVTMEDLEEARDKVCYGREKKRSRIMSDEDRRRIAYHEAAHALIAKLDDNVEPLHKVTIIPRGVAGGLTMLLPEKDKYTLQKRECLSSITMAMAGRVAEEMFCGDISSGAANDIKEATRLARKMVTQWGMSAELGPVSYSDEEEHVFLGNEITKVKTHGEQMAQKIDDEIRAILMECYQDARRVCEEHRDELQRTAEALLELETLSAEDVDRIFQGATVADLVAGRPSERPAQAQAPAREEPRRKPDEGPAADGLPQPAGSPA
jgi:cell division protease FtsH